MLKELPPIPENAPKAGEYYIHFKGCVAKVLCVGRHTETGELFVCYREVHSGDFFCRPFAMWDDEARPGVKRFTHQMLHEQAHTDIRDLLERDRRNNG